MSILIDLAGEHRPDADRYLGARGGDPSQDDERFVASKPLPAAPSHRAGWLPCRRYLPNHFLENVRIELTGLACVEVDFGSGILERF